VSGYVNHLDQVETPELCDWCGLDLPMTWVRDEGHAGFFFKKVPMRNGLKVHKRRCPEKCTEATCTRKKTSDTPFCAWHTPEAQAHREARSAERANAAAERAKTAEIRANRSMKRKEFGNPLTVQSLLKLTVMEFATLTMVAKGLERLHDDG